MYTKLTRCFEEVAEHDPSFVVIGVSHDGVLYVKEQGEDVCMMKSRLYAYVMLWMVVLMVLWTFLLTADSLLIDNFSTLTNNLLTSY